MLHGILGSGRNWTAPAKALVAKLPAVSDSVPSTICISRASVAGDAPLTRVVVPKGTPKNTRAQSKQKKQVKLLLVDLRGHGLSGSSAPPPHTLERCAEDVAATVAAATGAMAATPSSAAALDTDGGAPLVIGHSFGPLRPARAEQRERERKSASLSFSLLSRTRAARRRKGRACLRRAPRALPRTARFGILVEF